MRYHMPRRRSAVTPKKYAMMMLPISGTLIVFAAVVAIIEDVVQFRRGTFVVAGSGVE